MKRVQRTWLQWHGLLLTGLLLALLLPACQCGVNLITPNDWGKRLLATDLPDNTLDFEEQFRRKTIEKEFLLFNDGKEPLVIAAMTIVNDPDKTYKFIAPPKMPLKLKPGAVHGIKLKVAFFPKHAAEYNQSKIALFSPNTNNTDGDDNFYIPLRGTYRRVGPVLSCGEELDFGAVELGKSKTLDCEIRNEGNADLIIHRVEYNKEKGGNPIDFTWEGPQFPLTIPAGKTYSERIRITYRPTDYDPVEDEGFFLLDTNLVLDKNDQPRLYVKGKALVALVQIVPIYPPCQDDQDCNKIDDKERLTCQNDDYSGQSLCQVKKDDTPLLKFPYTRRGKTTTRTFEIRSLGDVPLRIRKIEFIQPYTTEFVLPKRYIKALPLVLNPREVKTITMEYTPRDLEQDEDEIRIVSNAINTPEGKVLLEGTPTGCDLVAQPLRLKFKSPKDPTGSEVMSVTLKNLGNAECVLEGIELKSGRTEPFSLEKLPRPKFQLKPNEEYVFDVRYRPFGQKTPDIAVVKSDDPDEPEIEIQLIPPKVDPQHCELQATPPLLSFGQVNPGSQRQLTTIVTNIGQSDCLINSLKLFSDSGPGIYDLAIPVPTPQRLAPNSTLRLIVRYRPPSKRGYKGRIEVNSNDPASPLQITLVSSWGRRCLEVVPSVADFGNTRSGCNSSKREIRVYHLGAVGCPSQISLTSAKLASGTSPEFKITDSPKLPFTLRAGQFAKFDMLYKPTNLGQDSGSLLIGTTVAGQSPLVVPLTGRGVDTDDQIDRYRQAQQPLADILFVIDNSCSMREEQNSLGANFQAFIQWAIKLKVNYHIGVTTTDVTGRDYPAGCFQGYPKYITPFTPNKEQVFQRNVKVGTKGSPIEQGLEAVYRAISAPVKDDPKCNLGFYRKDAMLSVIVVSDERNQSPNPLDFYINFLRNLKGRRNLDRVRLSVVVGPPPLGCNASGTGRATPAPQYWETARRLGGERASICNRDWANTLSKIGIVSFGKRKQFFLTRKPDLRTIVVRVNGKQIQEDPQNGWVYDKQTNSVLFSNAATPAPGASISIFYRAICVP